jgi:hypothetical protein
VRFLLLAAILEKYVVEFIPSGWRIKSFTYVSNGIPVSNGGKYKSNSVNEVVVLPQFAKCS